MFHEPVRVCFVCSGNICRSPTAEAVLRRQAADAGRGGLVAVDSAGTGDWHVGGEMDDRARRTLVHAGHDVPAHVAKQFTAADFATRDIVVALDSGHRNALWWLAAQTPDVAASRAKIVVLRAFDPLLTAGEQPDVGDPYYGGARGFQDVLAQVQRSCAELLTSIARAVDAGTDWDGSDVPAQQAGSPPL